MDNVAVVVRDLIVIISPIDVTIALLPGNLATCYLVMYSISHLDILVHVLSRSILDVMM